MIEDNDCLLDTMSLKEKLRGFFELMTAAGVSLENIERFWLGLHVALFPGWTEFKRIRELRKKSINILQADETFLKTLSEHAALLHQRDALTDAASSFTAMLSARPISVVRQEPVGHGGFHTGAIGTYRPEFHWVYDCGSWRTAGRHRLEERATELLLRLKDTSRKQLDILFISHFHDDHISGIEKLLNDAIDAEVTVNTVVIPYLSPAAVLGVVLSASSRGRVSKSLIEILGDPIGFLRRKGVRRVIVVFPRQDRSAGEDTLPPTPTTGSEVGSPYDILIRLPDESTPLWRNEDGIEVIDLPQGSVIEINDGYPLIPNSQSGISIDWCFIPYNQDNFVLSERVLRIAENILECEINSPDFMKRILGELRNKEGIRKLKNLYKVSDQNTISLSVYSGPIHGTSVNYITGKKVGWLLSGDSDLKSTLRVSEWVDFYKDQRRFIGFVMLPHHGAWGNFNSKIKQVAEDADFFATVMSEDKHRPSIRAQNQIGSEIKKVTEIRGIVSVGGPHEYQKFLAKIDWATLPLKESSDMDSTKNI